MVTEAHETSARGAKTGPQGAVLGKNRASPPSPPNRALVRVAVASRLMASHWKKTGENLRGSSVIGCGRWRAYGADSTIAEIQVDHRGPRLLGHFACRSVWSCDHCAKARVVQTRSWLRSALMPALDARGLSGSLVTLTLAHSYADEWSGVVAKLYEAFTLFDKRLSKHYAKAGSIGKLKALEAPVGRNGIHPHLHILLTHDASADLAALESAMRSAWSKAVAEVGGRVNEHGFDFKAHCVNDYAAKIESAHELASHGTKQARKKGKTLPQLLDRAAVGDKKAGAEWLRAMSALGGRMRFHAGNLPKKLGIPCPSEWEDEERAAALDAEAASKPLPVRITYPQFQHLKATDSRTGRSGLALILRAARGGDRDRVRRVVDALCAEADRKEEPGALRRMTEDYFDEILRTAAQRPMTPDEVIGYLEAKKRGYGGYAPHVSEAETDGISVPEATFAGSVLRASQTVFAPDKQGCP